MTADSTPRPDGLEDWHGTSLRPLAGGYSGETYVAGEGNGRAVLRIYGRQPERAAVDASLLRLVRGLIPVPAVLELRHRTATTPAVLVTEYVEGTRLDVALRADPCTVDQGVVAESLAGVLNALAGIPFLRFGMFADADLALSVGPLARDLRDWAERLRPGGRLSTWSGPDWEALLGLVDGAQDLLDEDASRRPPRAVLVHSDLNPKNVLVDQATSQVVALLDWEFAHAGSPYTDLGNLCRFEREPALVEPLLASLVRPPTGGPVHHLELGRAMDLWALIELAGRARPSPVQELATQLLLAQARAGDLGAWPWTAPRIDPRPVAAP